MRIDTALNAILALAVGVGVLHAQGKPQTAAQAPNPETTPGPQPPAQPLSWAAQVRKTVVFLRVHFRDGGSQAEAAGTGFFVSVPDARLSSGRTFSYLVTNRHMADPSVSVGHTVQVLGLTIQANKKLGEGEQGPSLVDISIPAGPWFFPDDQSVDLAVMPLGLDPSRIDYLNIPIDQLATEDVLKRENVSEGDSVFFAGFFAQFPGQQKIEPVLREGLLAMMPDEPIPTTLNRPGKIYLADMHSFHGNSGSPVFVNLAGYRNGMVITGVHILLLGILSGYMYESADLKLETATTYLASVGANSGITTIVPAEELRKLLNSSPLSQMRDSIVKNNR
jgi:hypothetical protein